MTIHFFDVDGKWFKTTKNWPGTASLEHQDFYFVYSNKQNEVYYYKEDAYFDSEMQCHDYPEQIQTQLLLIGKS